MSRQKRKLTAVVSSVFQKPLLLLSLFLLPTGANAFPIANNSTNLTTAKHKLIHKVAVFGKDDRKPVPKRYEALKSRIGLLYNGQSQILCTAFCLAPDIIGTAAHCLFGSKKSSKPQLSEFSFRIESGTNLSEARLAGSANGSTSHYVIAGTTGLRTRPPMDAPRDWALAKLASPACRFGTLKISPKPLKQLVRDSNKKNIFQIAFHWDYEHWKPAFSGPCNIKKYSGSLRWKEVQKLFAEANSLVLHTCDTGGASSGSPLLLETNEGPTVIGINVGSYEQSRVFIKAGRVVKRTRANIIANTGVNASAFAAFMGPLREATIIDNNDDLKTLQSGLKEMGIYRGKLDGLFGPRTRRAIKKYENRKKRPLTGLPTHTILQELALSPELHAAVNSSEIKSSVSLQGSVPLPTRKPTMLAAPHISTDDGSNKNAHVIETNAAKQNHANTPDPFSSFELDLKADSRTLSTNDLFGPGIQ